MREPASSSHGYEELIKFLLSSQLSNQLKDFTVFGSKHYKGKSGHEHQIDVSAEFKAAGTKILILVECKYYSHNVGIDDVMEFATRLEDIGAHKGILVTTIGFQRGAEKIAKSKGIALVIAHDLGWSPHIESPVAEMRRHAQFVEDARRFLSWLLGDSYDDATLDKIARVLARLDVTSPLGVKPVRFMSLAQRRKLRKGPLIDFGLQYARKFAPDHGFEVVGEEISIIVDSGGLFSLIALEIDPLDSLNNLQND